VAPTVAPTASATAKPTPTPHKAPRTVTILGTGDVLIHPQLWEQARADALAEGKTGYDFLPMLASIEPDVKRASLAICELESPLAPPQGPFEGWPSFSSPPQVLTALKEVGYDSCTTASNHTLDHGYAGVKRTLDELDAAGLKHTGSARSAAEAAKPLIITEPNGVRIAQLAYAFGFNGQHVPANEPWLANLTSIPAILAAAHRAKADGANIVVVSMHWGVEYNTSATALQREQAAELLASPDIDLILGDHPHVVEPAQEINGKWVIYSMGNQISRHADPVLASREGAMAMFTFTEVRPGKFVVTRAEVVPTLMQLSPKLRLVDLPRALADPRLSATLRASYLASVDHIRDRLDAFGAAKDGLIVG
jgi:poly-gamma-glutamate capsule biosynthesis protein CapA/YwtB (metallophosphatase superfamily)